MARIVWQEGKFLNIEVKKGLFVLAQMANDPYLFFYNIFSLDSELKDIKLGNKEVLFYVPVTRQFMKNSNCSTIKTIKPEAYFEVPEYWIDYDTEGCRTIQLWIDTQEEISVTMLGEGGGYLINKSKKSAKFIKELSPDDELIDNTELTNVRTYPELNERLFLCYKLNRNVDPLKDLIFGRKIPIEYNTYMRIIAGKIDKEEWETLNYK